MTKLFTSCPVCKGELSVSALTCTQCGLSLNNDFQLNKFNYLSDDEMTFLLSFLKHQGNLKQVQEEEGISYPFAKKKLQQLLRSLNLTEETVAYKSKEGDIDMSNLRYNANSGLASDIIKKMLLENGGRALVSSARGNQYEIRTSRDGLHFECDELPTKPPYEFRVFDVMVECMIKNGNRARKGNGRNFKLGEPDCDDTTLVGYIGRHYAGKTDGISVFDPVFVLVSVLVWAGIARNDRGVVHLTTNYLKAAQNEQ